MITWVETLSRQDGKVSQCWGQELFQPLNLSACLQLLSRIQTSLFLD
jgi:hypothetical protein